VHQVLEGAPRLVPSIGPERLRHLAGLALQPAQVLEGDIDSLADQSIDRELADVRPYGTGRRTDT
jgi:hypothetical protein